METESKYLKKIRDVLRKKNSGSSGGTIYSGPNTKAKYLNDIAKEVDKLDISGGGGSSESPIFIATLNVTMGGAYMTQTIEELDDALRNGKIVYFKLDNEILSYKETIKQGGIDYYVFDSIPSYQSDDQNNTLSIVTTTLKVSKNDRSITGSNNITTAIVTAITTAAGPIVF